MLQISTAICGYGDETWITKVSVLEMNETFYELKITGHGHCFHAMVGIHAYGAFLCIPSWQFGCELASFSDRFYNFYRIRQSLDVYISETLANAICLLPTLKKTGQ